MNKLLKSNRPANCYLSFAIDMAGDSQIQMIERVERRLHHLTVLTYNPRNAYASWNFEDKDHQRYVIDMNLHALENADFCLAIWDFHHPSWGMPIELAAAGKIGVPVVFISNFPAVQEPPMYLSQNLPNLRHDSKLAEIGRSVARLIEESSTEQWRVMNRIPKPIRRKKK